MRGFQEISFTSDQDRSRKFATHKKGMSIVRCVCGFKILVVPDLKAMNRAIKNHLTEHKHALDSLEQYLTEQVLIAASETNLPTHQSLPKFYPHSKRGLPGFTLSSEHTKIK